MSDVVDIATYNRLKSVAQSAKAEADRAEGALGQLMQQLQAEHGCSSVAEAEEKLELLRADEKAAVQEYNTALEEYRSKWPDLV